LEDFVGMANDRKVLGKISIEGVSKVFNPQTANEVTALSSMDLEVEAGEFISFVGPSGCGKSTLLRLIAGLDTATEGTIELDGEPISGTHYERGMVFQDPTLFPWLNVYKNISSGLKARNILKESKGTVERFIDMVGLNGFENSYPHQLSGGMAQRVSLARSLANNPKVLLLDEPFGALDAFTRMMMQDELIRIWHERGTTMMLVTHDVDEAIFLSDRIVVMRPRPSRVESILNVSIRRPRDRSYPEFLSLRVKILETLNFAKEPEALSYYL
jgi:NitT/TauT family transport system ATP-binding protein/sulfonate transport system ATP-binding protein